MIKGVKLCPLRQIVNPKGDLWHVYKSSDDGFCGFGEVYLTQVNYGEIKGWKKHMRHVLNIVVVSGRIKFVIYDDREDSTTHGMYEEYVLSPNDNYMRLVVPPGVWMAFCGLDNTMNMLLDLIPELHDPQESLNKDITNFRYDFNL